jgi:hypothetical protein
MKYAVEMDSGAIINIPRVMKTGSGIQKLSGGGGVTHRQNGYHISLFLFFFKINKVG